MINRGVVSAVTSCSSMRLSVSAAMLAQAGVCDLDLYWPSPSDVHAAETSLAPITQRRGDEWVFVDPHEVRDWLLRELKSAEDAACRRVRVVSMTTSFPAVSEPNGSVSREGAVDSIVTLLRVGEFLGVPCLQMRAGRCVYSSLNTDEDGEDCLLYDGEDAALSRLVQSLIDICARYRERFDADPSVGVALEIEPGESFLLRSTEHLNRLRIEEAVFHGNLPSGWVGVNCDIGHCLMLGIKPTDLVAGGDLVLPVFGAHVSDHCGHHASDLPPGYFRPLEEFDEWLQFYVGSVPTLLRSHPDALLHYSGHVSVELESIEDIQTVARACREIEQRLSSKGLGVDSLPPRETACCVLFADLRKSTAATVGLEVAHGVLELAEFTQKVYAIFVEHMRAIAPHARLDKFIGDAAMIVLEGAPEATAPLMMEIACSILGEGVRQACSLNPEFKGIGIGIGLGKVAAGRIGSGPFRTETVLGREVIFASRLSDAAEAGGVLVTPSFHRVFSQVTLDAAITWTHVEPGDSEVRLEKEEGEPYWKGNLN